MAKRRQARVPSQLLGDVHVKIHDALIDFSLAPIPAAHRQAAIPLGLVDAARN